MQEPGDRHSAAGCPSLIMEPSTAAAQRRSTSPDRVVGIGSMAFAGTNLSTITALQECPVHR